MSLPKPVGPTLSLQLLQITIRLAQHPNRERELEVRVRDSDCPIEHPLYRFLRPRTVLQREQNPNLSSIARPRR